jgi:hypothetical protein
MHERRIASLGLAFRLSRAVPSLLVVASWLAVALVGAWSSPHVYGQQNAPAPLYRFAWESCSPSPYEIYCFYQPPLPDTDLDFHQRLAQEIAGSNVNLVFTPLIVDGSLDPQRLPPIIGASWTSLASQGFSKPVYLCFSPGGKVLHEGPFEGPLVSTLVESPARKRLAEQLAKGQQVLVVSLPGSDEAATTLADEAIRKAIDQAAGSGPNVARVASYTISRVEPAEEWLRRILRSSAAQTPDNAEPVACVVYGRGRMLTVRIADGQNLAKFQSELAGDLTLASSPYSGSRDLLPGEDLLLAYDWTAAVDQAMEAATKPPAPVTPPPATGHDEVKSEANQPIQADRSFFGGVAPMLTVTLGVLFLTILFIIRPR